MLGIWSIQIFGDVSCANLMCLFQVALSSFAYVASKCSVLGLMFLTVLMSPDNSYSL